MTDCKDCQKSSGMGCWELGMQDPDLFAAIAPIAAYHKGHLRSEIAEARLWLPGLEPCVKPESYDF